MIELLNVGLRGDVRHYMCSKKNLGLRSTKSLISMFSEPYGRCVLDDSICMLACSLLQMCGDPGISAFPDGDNIFCWKGTITGSKETVYEGMIYKLSFSFPTDYPFKPPKVKFETACFHPNVDIYGNICLDILQVWRWTKSPSFLLRIPHGLMNVSG